MKQKLELKTYNKQGDFIIKETHVIIKNNKLLMKKLKKLWPLFLSLAILVILIILALARPRVILFYGNTCPHCEKVQEYLNQQPNSIRYRHLEVYANPENANLMAQKAKSCGLQTDQIGVPFLFDGQKCLIGDQDIINWFKQQ